LIFSVDSTIVFNVFKGVRGETSIAAVVVVVASAINELLFTNVSESAIFHIEVSFKRAYCRESPAASTLALILNWSNYSLVSPVPVRRHILDLLEHISPISGRAFLLNAQVVVVKELLLSHITELIDALLVGAASISVVLDDLLHLLCEDGLAIYSRS
jgi:hypothetical protein